MINDRTSFTNLRTDEFYFPKVLPVRFETIPLLFRWCLSNEELFVDGPLRNIRGHVHFRIPSKFSSSKEYQRIAKRIGWLTVTLLSVENPNPSQYLLVACFIDFDRRIPFPVIQELFDHVESVTPLETVPDDVLSRSKVDLAKHEQISLAHWSKTTKTGFHDRIQSIENQSTQTILQLQKQIDQLSEIIQAIRLSEVGDYLVNYPTSDIRYTKESHIQELVSKRQALRSMLTEEESSTDEEICMLIEASNSPPSLLKRELFTMRWWAVGEPPQ